MDKYLDTAYNVSGQLFGPDSGIPWWAWIIVPLAVFWKFLIPERKTAEDLAHERDEEMLNSLLSQMSGEDDGKGKKGKKPKKAKKK